MIKPFNGDAKITQEYSSSHPGIDFALGHRTAILSPFNGKVVLAERNIELKTGGIKKWIANTANDPFLTKFGTIIIPRPTIDNPSKFRKLRNEDYGNFIKIDHSEGVETLYAHLDEVVVTEGQMVKKNQLIGYADSTGNSTGNHLHFEVWLNGKRIDPEYFETMYPDFEGMFYKGNYEFFVYDAKIEILSNVEKLLIRSIPDRKGSRVKVNGQDYYAGGISINVVGFVKGERVEAEISRDDEDGKPIRDINGRVIYDRISTQFWWVTKEGNYIWAGGTSVIPTLDEFPDQMNKKFKKLQTSSNKEKLMEELKNKLSEREEKVGELHRLETERNNLTNELASVESEIAELRTAIDELDTVVESIPTVEEVAPEVNEPVSEPVEEAPVPVEDGVEHTDLERLQAAVAEVEALKAKLGL